MIHDEAMPTTYHLFDHSYAGGSWNMAVIEQAAVLKKRAETAEARAETAEAEVVRLQAEAAAGKAEQQEFLRLFHQKQQGLEAQVLKLATSAMGIAENNARLRSVVDAFYAYRKHVYFCDDCGDGEPCEEGEQLYQAALTAMDSVCGRPTEAP